MVNELDNLKGPSKKVDSKALANFKEGKCFEGSLKETLSSLKDLEEEA